MNISRTLPIVIGLIILLIAGLYLLGEISVLSNDLVHSNSTPEFSDSLKLEGEINEVQKERTNEEENRVNEEDNVVNSDYLAEFEKIQKYIFGSLEHTKYLKSYSNYLTNKKENYIASGVDKDAYYNTLSLVKKRIIIKENRFRILCFIDKVPCEINTRSSIHIEDYNRMLSELKGFAEDKNALTPGQRKELSVWLDNYTN
jgi:uncharacterized membrane protein